MLFSHVFNNFSCNRLIIEFQIGFYIYIYLWLGGEAGSWYNSMLIHGLPYLKKKKKKTENLCQEN